MKNTFIKKSHICYFSTDKTPTSFNEAIDIFRMLPCKAQENERVVSFSIAPVSLYCIENKKTDAILNKISNQNMQAVSKMVVEFDEVKHFFKILKNYDFTKRFQNYLKMILHLERLFNKFKTEIHSNIQALLPKVIYDIKLMDS